MVQRYLIQGYDNFLNFMKKFDSKAQVFILYTGSKLENGKSWCPDCVQAEPFIEEGIKNAPESSNFVVVEVGDRPYWKDLKCPFRTNPITKLNVLPTLARWGTQKRLEGNQCLDKDLINMLLMDED